MARRRRRSRRRRGTFGFSRGGRRRRRGGKGMHKVFIGLALTSTIEPLIDNLAGSVGFNVSDDLIKLGAGWWLSKKHGYMKGIGYGLFGRAAGNLVGDLLKGGGIGGLFGGGSPTGAGVDPSIVR